MNNTTPTKEPPAERKTVSISVENRDGLEQLRNEMDITPKLQALTDKVIALGLVELRKRIIPDA